MTDTTTARPMRPTHQDDDPHVRAIGHPRHPVVSGGLIGVIGGAAFLFGGGIAGVPAEHQDALRGVAISLISFTGTGAWIGDSLSHAACAVVGFMIISYSTGVNRPSRSCRRRR